jgi:hypothetical protein
MSYIYSMEYDVTIKKNLSGGITSKRPLLRNVYKMTFYFLLFCGTGV